MVSGRLFARRSFRQALWLTREAERSGIPVIGGGGVYSRAQAEALLESRARSPCRWMPLFGGANLPEPETLIAAESRRVFPRDVRHPPHQRLLRLRVRHPQRNVATAPATKYPPAAARTPAGAA